MASFDDVLEIGLSLPGVERTTSYGTPSLKVGGRGGKMVARLREDGETLVVQCSREEREMLLESDPDTFAVTDHYHGHDLVLIRLAAAERDLLDERLTESWRLVAPARLLAELEDA